MAKTHTPPNHPTPIPAAASPPPVVPPYTEEERQEILDTSLASAIGALRSFGGDIEHDDAMAFLRLAVKPEANPGAPPVRVVEAFAGGGILATGLDAAIIRAGCRPHHLAYAELADGPAATYAMNIGARIQRYEDVWQIADGQFGAPPTQAEQALLDQLRAAAGPGAGDDVVDVLAGGPPCQPYSKARRHVKPTAETTRLVHLYGRMVRLAEVVRPRLLLIENVEKSLKHPLVQGYLLHLRDHVGYRLSACVLNTADVGVAQARVRFLVVGVRADLGQTFDVGAMLTGSGTRRHTALEALWDLRPDPSSPETVGDPIAGAGVLHQRIRWMRDDPFTPLPPDLQCKYFMKNGGRPWADTYRRMRADEPSGALTRNWPSPAHGAFLHPFEFHSLSRRDAMRLQGLPDHFRLHPDLTDAQAELLIGNGAPPQIGLAVIGQAFQQGILHRGQATDAFADLSLVLSAGLAAREIGAPSMAVLAAADGIGEDRCDEADIRRAAKGQRMSAFAGLCRVLAAAGHEIAWSARPADAIRGHAGRWVLAARIAGVLDARCRTEHGVVLLTSLAGVDRDVVAGWAGLTTKPMVGPRRPLTLAERGHRFRTLSAVGRALGVTLVVRPIMDAADRAEARRLAVAAIASCKPLAATSLARRGSAA